MGILYQETIHCVNPLACRECVFLLSVKREAVKSLHAVLAINLASSGMQNSEVTGHKKNMGLQG